MYQQKRNLIYHEGETQQGMRFLPCPLKRTLSQERKGCLCLEATSLGGGLKRQCENSYLEKINQKLPHRKQLGTNIIFFLRLGFINNRIEKCFSFFSAVLVDVRTLEGIQQLLRTRPSALQAQQSEQGGGMTTLHQGSWRAAITQVYLGLECIHVVLAMNQAEQW